MPAGRRLPDLALLALSTNLLKVSRPLLVHSLMVWLGARLPSHGTPEDARRAARAFGRRGTCLSRALAVAARAPTADVVIAVEPRGGAPLFAHAWVEMNGAPIDPEEAAGVVIARLRGPRSTSPDPAGSASGP